VLPDEEPLLSDEPDEPPEPVLLPVPLLPVEPVDGLVELLEPVPDCGVVVVLFFCCFFFFDWSVPDWSLDELPVPDIEPDEPLL
jgi:hypothetical protein